MSQVTKSVSASQNFQGSVSAILVFVLWGTFEALGGFGLDLSGKQDLAIQLAEAVRNMDYVKIITVAMPSLIIPFLKFQQNGGFTIDNLKNAWKNSSNFRKDVAIFAGAVFGFIGISQLTPEFILDIFNNGFSVGTIVTGLIAVVQFVISVVKIGQAQDAAAEPVQS